MPPLQLAGTQVLQGNRNGRTLQAAAANSVLWTSDMDPCVAVCGSNGATVFMIHSDSTGTGGKGQTDLMTGLRALVADIGTGEGYTVTLMGGSIPGVKTYLKKEGNLTGAVIVEGEASDSAYITSGGVAASTKAKLATALGVDSVTVT